MLLNVFSESAVIHFSREIAQVFFRKKPDTPNEIVKPNQTKKMNRCNRKEYIKKPPQVIRSLEWTVARNARPYNKFSTDSPSAFRTHFQANSHSCVGSGSYYVLFCFAFPLCVRSCIFISFMHCFVVLAGKTDFCIAKQKKTRRNVFTTTLSKELQIHGISLAFLLDY